MINLLRLCALGIMRERPVATHPESYKHQPESVIENDKVKILWDFNIYIDVFLKDKRPDIVVVDKEEKDWVIIDTQ